MLPFRISPSAAAYQPELHFSGVVITLLTTKTGGCLASAREDVLEEIKRLSLKGLLIVQAAGDVIRIGWKQQDMEALCDVLTKADFDELRERIPRGVSSVMRAWSRFTTSFSHQSKSSR